LRRLKLVVENKACVAVCVRERKQEPGGGNAMEEAESHVGSDDSGQALSARVYQVARKVARLFPLPW
jgi:hypothetical protein